MNLSLAELVAAVAGTCLRGEDSVRVSGFGSLGEAQAGEVAFLGDRRYRPLLAKTAASVVLVERGVDFGPELARAEGPALVAVDHPSRAFGALVTRFAPPRPALAAGRHPTAVVHPEAELAESVALGAHAVVEAGARLDDGVVLGAGAFVGAGARLGARTSLGPHAVVGDGCVLGADCVIHAGAVIGADGFGFEFEGGEHRKVPQLGIVELGDAVEVGANSCIDRARFGVTRIGKGTKIDNLVQVGHNCRLGEHNILCGQAGIAGSTTTGAYVIVAAQAGINGHCQVVDQVTIGARGGCERSLDEPGIYTGFPIQKLGEWRRQSLLVTQLPEMRRELKELRRAVEQLSAAAGSAAGIGPENAG